MSRHLLKRLHSVVFSHPVGYLDGIIGNGFSFLSPFSFYFFHTVLPPNLISTALAPSFALASCMKVAMLGSSSCIRCQIARLAWRDSRRSFSIRSTVSMGIIFKPHVFTSPDHLHMAGGAVAIFHNLNFRNAFIWTVLVVDFIPIERHDVIGFLLNGP